jgi:hypothetical protein
VTDGLTTASTITGRGSRRGPLWFLLRRCLSFVLNDVQPHLGEYATLVVRDKVDATTTARLAAAAAAAKTGTNKVDGHGRRQRGFRSVVVDEAVHR